VGSYSLITPRDMTTVRLSAELKFERQGDRHNDGLIGEAEQGGSLLGTDQLVGNEVEQCRSSVGSELIDKRESGAQASDGLPMICNASDGLNPEQAFAAWCRHMSPLFDVRTLDGCDAEQFCFRFDVIHCNRFLLGRFHSCVCRKPYPG
jgi:hypothetical protein